MEDLVDSLWFDLGEATTDELLDHLVFPQILASAHTEDLGDVICNLLVVRLSIHINIFHEQHCLSKALRDQGPCVTDTTEATLK